LDIIIIVIVITISIIMVKVVSCCQYHLRGLLSSALAVVRVIPCSSSSSSSSSSSLPSSRHGCWQVAAMYVAAHKTLAFGMPLITVRENGWHN
jgi:hypothetical protein